MSIWIAGKDLMKYLPPKHACYNDLNLEEFSDKDYLHPQKVWKEFETRNLGEYHDLYVQRDHYCSRMFMKNLEINALEYIDWILLISYRHQD